MPALAVERPQPPLEMVDSLEAMLACTFRPALEVEEWIRATLLAEAHPLYNEDHAHLGGATLGILWATQDARRQMRRIVGTAELGPPRATDGFWAKARREQQLLEWFPDVPDFLVTLSAPYAASVGDVDWCALVDHELYHCSCEYSSRGKPTWRMRGHDAEEFVGVVRRYGAGASADGVSRIVAAAKRRPEVGRRAVDAACGTCKLRLA